MEAQNATPPRPRITDQQIDAFIAERGGLGFPKVLFRRDAAASLTTHFGIDTTTGSIASIRIHLGTDRAQGKTGQVYAPFPGTVRIEESSDYGTLVRINVLDDFEVRIGHMKLDTIKVPHHGIVEAGDLIGPAGCVGRSTGIHTHTEIVSLHGDSCICEVVLKAKALFTRYFTEDELRNIAKGLWDDLERDMVRKGVSVVSPVKIRKFDHWTGRVQTYYDSYAVFGI